MQWLLALWLAGLAACSSAGQPRPSGPCPELVLALSMASRPGMWCDLLALSTSRVPCILSLVVAHRATADGSIRVDGRAGLVGTDAWWADSGRRQRPVGDGARRDRADLAVPTTADLPALAGQGAARPRRAGRWRGRRLRYRRRRSEEHTSELQSQSNLVCRLLLEKK